MTIGNRIKSIRVAKNMTQGELANYLGIPQSNLFRYENDTGKLTSEKIEKFYQLGINVNWLITGEGEMFRGDENTEIVKSSEVKNANEEVVRVKKLDVKASAGVGFVNYQEDIRVWVELPASFIYPYDPRYVSLLEVDGSSMEPTIKHGDSLLVSEQDTRLVSERVYIIRMHDELKVKRIIRLGNGNIIVWSENEHYGREEFTPQQWQDYEISIVAKVIKVIKDV